MDREIVAVSKKIETKNEALYSIHQEIEKIAGPKYKQLKEAVESLEFEIKDLFDDLQSKEVDFETFQKGIKL